MKYCYLPIFLLFASIITRAQWTDIPTVNLQLSSLQSGDVITGATSDGGTFIAFYSAVSGNFEMRVQYLDAQGIKQFGPDGMVINNLPTGSATYVFNAIVDANNNFIVAYNDQRNGSNGTAVNLVTRSGTMPWGLNGVYLGPGLSPYPTVLSTGEILVAWNNISNRISYQKLSNSGVPQWSPAKEIFPIINGRQISRVQTVTHTGGKFGMVFQQRNGTIGSPTPTTLYEQQFDNDGNPVWAAPVAMSNYVTSNSRYFSVLSYGDLTYVGYYANPPGQNRFDAFLQLINGDGTLPWGINGSDFATDPTPYEMTVNINYPPGSSEVWAVSTFSNSFQSQYGIYVQKFNSSTGARLLSDNAMSVIPINANGEQQKGALSMYNGTDPMFMFYDVTNKIYATRLNNSGNFVWSPTSVLLAGTSASKLRFNFTSVNNGQAVAAWAETRPPSLFDQPYAQNISAAGVIGPLPVTLVYFNGSLIDDKVDLLWKTLTENNNRGFVIQRSIDGRNFNDIGFIASEAVNGNSSVETHYQYIDKSYNSGANFYRLKQIDKDGRFVYSQVVSILVKTTLFVEKIYPLPSDRDLHVRLYSPQAQSISMIIADVLGKVWQKTQLNVKEGSSEYLLNVSALSKGVYILQINNVQGRMETKKFVK